MRQHTKQLNSRHTDTRDAGTRYVIVGDAEPRPDDTNYGLPYSKGLMASSIMATGLAPTRAFHVAEVIEERLRENFNGTISQAELSVLALAVLREEAGERYADLYVKWHTVKRLSTPLVVLLGGATGVGKSTIATMLASRLGVTRVIPTDAIREVMRAMFTAELFPTLQSSSFETSRVMRHPAPGSDPVIGGFREQATAVSVGITALIKRAIEESSHLIVEGAHVVPGFVDLDRYRDRAVIVPVVISVDDDELHRSHFVLRSAAAHERPWERYLENFDQIRGIQRYVGSMAAEHGVPVVNSFDLDATLATVIDLVVSEAIRAIPHAQEPSDLPGATRADAPKPPSQQSRTHEKRGTR